MTTEGAADGATHVAPIVTCPLPPFLPTEGRGMTPAPGGGWLGWGRNPAGGAEDAEVDAYVSSAPPLRSLLLCVFASFPT